MVILNDVGLELSEIVAVTALTDVTGFGLMGHLLEVCEGVMYQQILTITKCRFSKKFMAILIKNVYPEERKETGTVTAINLILRTKGDDISYVIHRPVEDC